MIARRRRRQEFEAKIMPVVARTIANTILLIVFAIMAAEAVLDRQPEFVLIAAAGIALCVLSTIDAIIGYKIENRLRHLIAAEFVRANLAEAETARYKRITTEKN